MAYVSGERKQMAYVSGERKQMAYVSGERKQMAYVSGERSSFVKGNVWETGPEKRVILPEIFKIYQKKGGSRSYARSSKPV